MATQEIYVFALLILVSNACKILPVGDSITAGGGPPAGAVEDAAAYRHRLETLFQRHDIQAEFVGDACRNCNVSDGPLTDHRCAMGCKQGKEKDKFIAFWSVSRNILAVGISLISDSSCVSKSAGDGFQARYC